MPVPLSPHRRRVTPPPDQTTLPTPGARVRPEPKPIPGSARRSGVEQVQGGVVLSAAVSLIQNPGQQAPNGAVRLGDLPDRYRPTDARIPVLRRVMAGLRGGSSTPFTWGARRGPCENRGPYARRRRRTDRAAKPVAGGGNDGESAGVARQEGRARARGYP